MEKTKEKTEFKFNANEPEFYRFKKIAKKQNRKIANALNCAIQEYIDKYKGLI